MDGLIKGLMDVALGGHDDKDDDASNSQSRDERSRSSWAQVVSGDQDNDDLVRLGSRPTNRWENQSDGIQEEWNLKPSRRSTKEVHEGYERNEGHEQHDYDPNQCVRKDEGENSNDGWETVGKKHRKRPHKIQKEQWHGYKRPPSEQEYSDDVEDGIDLVPSQEELSDLSQACNRLWQLDINRLVPGKDYQIDCGDGKKVYEKEDMAQGSLFSWLNEEIFRKPTFSRFCSLLDNYNPNEGCKEVITSEERQEQAAFIEEISRTAPIKYLHKYLASRAIVSDNYQDFKRTLTSLWFDLYGRGGTSGSSSAFEHVFVGEIKKRGEQEVSGFHNWLQFYLEEAKGTVDYQGYIFPRRHGQTPDSETQLLTVQFEWNGILKSVSSILVGVSPEFEVALYTLCFYMGGEDNHVELGPYPVNIKCYRLRDCIGSVFPIAEC
ncbi:uridylate-specific endoribonuclease B isoform X2 [Ricinus communis]|uniref:uridylate-specific endoribonuclease B isoform X2 n=1 Tax=Ricinus communis TaxID=3988 RepID=UPI00201AC4E3|nr:uridylate-specific endoribonuclease B isoform X2 [Ricinus communis]